MRTIRARIDSGGRRGASALKEVGEKIRLRKVESEGKMSLGVAELVEEADNDDIDSHPQGGRACWRLAN